MKRLKKYGLKSILLGLLVLAMASGGFGQWYDGLPGLNLNQTWTGDQDFEGTVTIDSVDVAEMTIDTLIIDWFGAPATTGTVNLGSDEKRFSSVWGVFAEFLSWGDAGGDTLFYADTTNNTMVFVGDTLRGLTVLSTQQIAVSDSAKLGIDSELMWDDDNDSYKFAVADDSLHEYIGASLALIMSNAGYYFREPIQMLNNQYMQFRNNANDDWINMFKGNTSDEMEMGSVLNIDRIETPEATADQLYVILDMPANLAAGDSLSALFRQDGSNLFEITSRTNGDSVWYRFNDPDETIFVEFFSDNTNKTATFDGATISTGNITITTDLDLATNTANILIEEEGAIAGAANQFWVNGDTLLYNDGAAVHYWVKTGDR